MKNKDAYHVIGLMSGTSLDGVDLAYCRFWKEGTKWRVALVEGMTAPYPAELKSQLSQVTALPQTEIDVLDEELGKFYGALIQRFSKHKAVDFIASHGHTVFHQPELQLTLQIGNGQLIHQLTNLPVVNNFRALDVSLGGQGAPLVPVGDRFLFGEFDFCLNLGGIANISYEQHGKRLAFDIAPCNMLLNKLAHRKGYDFDEGGKLASTGRIIPELLKKWESFEFYQKSPPKSLGFEWVSEHYFDDLLEGGVPDLMRTASEHISNQIASVIQSNSGHRVLVTGGGAKNEFLITLLQEKIKPKSIELPATEIIDYKEAMIFGFLGVLRVRNEFNVLAEVTGASRDTSSGDMIGF